MVCKLSKMKKASIRVKNKGFTLIEIVIVLFFSGILMVVLFNLYDWHGRVYGYQQAYVRVSSANRVSISTMQSYISQANRVLDNATINGIAYTTGIDTLVLQIPSVDESNDIISSKWDKVVFYPVNRNFYMQLEPDPVSSRRNIYKILDDTLQSVTFTYSDAIMSQVKNIVVNFISSQQVRQQTISLSMNQSMYLLNY